MSVSRPIARLATRATKTLLGNDRLGRIEYFVKPRLSIGFGGPFNGQAFRRRIFDELVSSFGFIAVVETGTCRGTTTELLRHRTAVPVYTVELNPRFHAFAAARFRRDRWVHTVLGDSRSFLAEIAVGHPEFRTAPVFVYLDAHWGDFLPLRAEVETVFANWPEAIVMVDDFQVPDDDGYGFDDYGPGKRLSLELLDRLTVTAFFPVLPGRAETGLRRGCVILAAQPPSCSVLRNCSTVREWIIAGMAV